MYISYLDLSVGSHYHPDVRKKPTPGAVALWLRSVLLAVAFDRQGLTN